jgi:hypothetical protein
MSTPLQLEEGEWTSIYIPVIPPDLTMDNGDMRYNDQSSFAELFEDQLKIGQVSRIDFVTRSNKKGRSAYVHFDHWYDNSVAKYIRDQIQTKDLFVCNGFYDGYEFCEFDRLRFIVFKVNNRPIPEIVLAEDLNVPQLIARVKELEQEIARLKSFTRVPVPGTNVLLDIGPILAENARLKEAKTT